MKNCVLIGLNAGVDLPENSKGIVIIGRNIRSLDHSQPDVVFIGDNVAISKSIWEYIIDELSTPVGVYIKEPGDSGSH